MLFAKGLSDYNENASDSDRRFDYLDFYLTIPLWKKARITIGLQKEPFIYEMVGDAANLPQQERVLGPFFISRNVGIKYQDDFLKDEISFSIGAYNIGSGKTFHFIERDAGFGPRDGIAYRIKKSSKSSR